MSSFIIYARLAMTVIRSAYRIFRTFYSGNAHALNFWYNQPVASRNCCACAPHHSILTCYLLISKRLCVSRPRKWLFADTTENPYSRSRTSINNQVMLILRRTSWSPGSSPYSCPFS